MAIRWDEMEGANFGPYLYSIENEAERLEVLFRECYDEILKHCQTVLSRAGNRADVDDAAQEAIIRAAQAVRRTYKPEKPFRPWLYKVAGNVCVDFGRVQRRADMMKGRCIERGYGVDPHTPAPAADTPEEALIRKVLSDAVLKSLLVLPEAERNALYRRVYEGLSYEEISALEGHSHSSVRTAIYRAKNKMKSQLMALGGPEEWGMSGVVGVMVGLARRMRARSRAWMLRNGARGSNLAADGAPLNVALVARATEVVAAGFVALGALALPHGGAVAAAPIPPMRATPAAAFQAAVPTQDAVPPAVAGGTVSRLPVAPAAAPEHLATEVKVSSPDGSGTGYTATVERDEDHIHLIQGPTGPIPVFGEDYQAGGDTRYPCSRPSGQLICGVHDQLPPGP